MKARGGSMYQTHIHVGAIIAGKEKDAETRGKEGSGVAGEGGRGGRGGEGHPNIK